MIDPLKIKIIYHIAYRDIFNAPLCKKDLISWFSNDCESDAQEAVQKVINELINEELIVEKNNLIAPIKNITSIEQQTEKQMLTNQLLSKGATFLKVLSYFPFIKYIGLSGALAANNPCLNKKEDNDLDIFMICSSHCLWIVFFIEKICTNLLEMLTKRDRFYCFNYATDASFLEVHNQSFYTATELVNLKTLHDKGLYERFISENYWYTKYYNKEIINGSNVSQKRAEWTILFMPLNAFFYILFCLVRGLKNRSLKRMFEFGVKFNPYKKCNYRRIANPHGGYQDIIKQKFKDSIMKNFKNYYSNEVFDKYFPENRVLSPEPYKSKNQKLSTLFSKYSKHEMQ